MTREELNARMASIEADIVDVVKEAIGSGIPVGVSIVFAHTDAKHEDFDGSVTAVGELPVAAAANVNFLLSDDEEGKEYRDMVVNAFKHYVFQMEGTAVLNATPKTISVLKATKLKS